MSTHPRQTLNRLIVSPSPKTTPSEMLLDYLHSRSATTVHKIQQLRSTDHQISMPRTQEAFEAYFQPKAIKKSETMNPPKKRRTGSSHPDLRTLLQDTKEPKTDSTKIKSQAFTKTFEDSQEQVLEQIQEKLLATISQVSEMKHELSSYDRFFAELYDFIGSSDSKDVAALSLTKMRNFYKLRKNRPETARSSKTSTPETRNLELKPKRRLVKTKSDRKLTSNLSPYRNVPVKISRMLSPAANSAQSPSLRILTSKSNRSETPLDQLETTAQKLEFIKQRTFAVLEAWERDSVQSRRG